ncbi:MULTISPECIES: S-layer homology domain-containing protein [unclassified Paenibacillus]|nr:MULTISPECIES: S-layer homology domain-containing protein [unclassified Paenibacillus]
MNTDAAGEYVYWAATGSGLMNGYSGGSFRPDEKISRSELAALITRAFKLTGTGNASFTDVQKNAWYYASIDVLASNNIITGCLRAEDIDQRLVPSLQSLNRFPK